MAITHLNPEGMHKNPAFSQAVVAEGVKKLVFVGGQNAVDASGKIVGNDLKTQTAQALKNVLTALAAAGASQKDVTRLGIYVVAGQDIREGFAASQEVWGQHATTITVLQVAALGRPEFLVEIEATAAL